MSVLPESLVYGKNDTKPILQVTAKVGTTERVQDWTGADSVKLFLRARSDGSFKINGAAAAFDAVRTTGILKYTWQATDLNTAVDYDVYFIVYWTAGSADPQTVGPVELLVKEPWEMP